eukprot:7590364-Pyramimonas_sp.AAC.2
MCVQQQPDGGLTGRDVRSPLPTLQRQPPYNIDPSSRWIPRAVFEHEGDRRTRGLGTAIMEPITGD